MGNIKDRQNYVSGPEPCGGAKPRIGIPYYTAFGGDTNPAVFLNGQAREEQAA